MEKRKRVNSRVVQIHHITYRSLDGLTPERTVRLFKGEHWLITWMNRRKHVSAGFIEALEDYINRNKLKREVL